MPRQNRNRQRRATRKGNETTKDLVVMPRQFGFAPPRLHTSLRYTSIGTINNVGTTAASNRYRPTNAFDVDPLLASTAMPGFAEYALLYTRYRVTSSKIMVDFMNLESFPLIVAILPVQTDPGSNHLASVTTRFLGQPVCHSKPVGAITGLSVAQLGHQTSTAKIAGVSDLNTADDYSSGVGAGPLLNWYWDVMILSNSVLASGVFVHVTVDVQIEFFSLAQPNN